MTRLNGISWQKRHNISWNFKSLCHNSFLMFKWKKLISSIFYFFFRNRCIRRFPLKNTADLFCFCLLHKTYLINVICQIVNIIRAFHVICCKSHVWHEIVILKLIQNVRGTHVYNVNINSVPLTQVYLPQLSNHLEWCVLGCYLHDKGRVYPLFARWWKGVVRCDIYTARKADIRTLYEWPFFWFFFFQTYSESKND